MKYLTTPSRSGMFQLQVYWDRLCNIKHGKALRVDKQFQLQVYWDRLCNDLGLPGGAGLFAVSVAGLLG